MGEAKQRGTYEQRVQQAQIADAIIQKAFASMSARARVLYRFGGNKRALAAAVIHKQQEENEQKRIET